jgi:glucose-6-phosphate isomerase
VVRKEEQVTADRINNQILNLGQQDTVTMVTGGAMVEAAIEPGTFHSLRLKPCIDRMEQERYIQRLWNMDGSLWRSEPEEQAAIPGSLGWLRVVERMKERTDDMDAFVRSIKEAGFTHVVHMGMGGSSLAPLVLQSLFRTQPGGLPVTVLDTTDPLTVSQAEQRENIKTTLFIVASKSGTTSEPAAFCDYFFDKVRALKGQKAGENFVAITDPGTPLVTLAEERGFNRVFLNFADIGGRYSALSYFGLLPGALMGLDVRSLLEEAAGMVRACGPAVPVNENPGALLGAAMGEMALAGRDKVTFLLPPNLASLGMWLEQLIAESTGKEDMGILPVAGEPAGNPLAYGNDRLFVYIYLKGRVDSKQEESIRMLQTAGLPVIFIEMRDEASVVQEFFRWEVATAIAGAILGINPFDQPNVQESKDATNRLLKSVQERGSLTEPAPVMTHGPIGFFGKDGAESPEALLWKFLSLARPGDYVSFQAYLPEDPETESMLETIRVQIRDSLQVATTIGYGPRFLHSTGQFHKGGPNTGVFFQLTARDSLDISIPGKPYTFGIFKRAQALGDLEALARHGRRVMRIDLGDNTKKGLAFFRRLVAGALSAGSKSG